MLALEHILLSIAACLLTVLGMRQLLILLLAKRFTWKNVVSGLAGAGFVVSQTILQGDVAVVVAAASGILISTAGLGTDGGHHG